MTQNHAGNHAGSSPASGTKKSYEDDFDPSYDFLLCLTLQKLPIYLRIRAVLALGKVYYEVCWVFVKLN